jgi:hypothetical protein
VAALPPLVMTLPVGATAADMRRANRNNAMRAQVTLASCKSYAKALHEAHAARANPPAEDTNDGDAQ